MIEIDLNETRGVPSINVVYQPEQERNSRLGKLVEKFIQDVNAAYAAEQVVEKVEEKKADVQEAAVVQPEPVVVPVEVVPEVKEEPIKEKETLKKKKKKSLEISEI
jgi:hypothetical protein